MTATHHTVDTPDGPFTLVEDAEGRVIASGWTDDVGALLGRVHPDLRPDDTSPAQHPSQNAQAVQAYYAGDVTAIHAVEVHQSGTPGQCDGWAHLRRIDPGHPLTYTQFAEALGNPRAVRAAASICARNAVALFVPCHRVLRGDGTMGGFAWGEDVKRSLLAREEG